MATVILFLLAWSNSQRCVTTGKVATLSQQLSWFRFVELLPLDQEGGAGGRPVVLGFDRGCQEDNGNNRKRSLLELRFNEGWEIPVYSFVCGNVIVTNWRNYRFVFSGQLSIYVAHLLKC